MDKSQKQSPTQWRTPACPCKIMPQCRGHSTGMKCPYGVRSVIDTDYVLWLSLAHHGIQAPPQIPSLTLRRGMIVVRIRSIKKTASFVPVAQHRFPSCDQLPASAAEGLRAGTRRIARDPSTVETPRSDRTSIPTIPIWQVADPLPRLESSGAPSPRGFRLRSGTACQGLVQVPSSPLLGSFAPSAA